MRLLVIGATGRLGRLVVQQALERGHAVTAAARHPEAIALDHPRLALATVDVRRTGSLNDALPGHDAVLSTLGYRRHDETPDVLEVGMRHLASAMGEAGVQRLVALSVAGILQGEVGLRCERPGYPEAFRAGAAMHRRAWELLAASALAWTLVCPPELVAGRAHQPLLVRARELPEGPRRVSMPALARWMVATAVAPCWLRERVGVLDAPD